MIRLGLPAQVYLSDHVVIQSDVVLVGMVASGAYLWGLCSFEHITADQTLPFDRFLTFPDSAVFYLFQEIFETVSVATLDFSN